MDVILFLVFAIIAVVCAINVVVQTHPISSAISLVGVMGSLAVLYLLLGAEFLAAAQVIVYAGAVMVLFVFVIMLLNAGAEAKQGPVADGAIAGRAAADRVPRADGLLRAAPVPAQHHGALRRIHRRRHVRGDRHALCSPPTCCRSK